MYKTYSFVYEKRKIKEILELRGYIVKTLCKVMDTIPSLKDIKDTVFRSEDEICSRKYRPSILYRVRLAWRTDQELREIQMSVERLAEAWKKDTFYRKRYNMPIHFLMWHLDEGNKYTMENVFGKLLKEQINKI